MVAKKPKADPFDRDERFRDFRVFLCHVWRHVIGQDPSPLQYEYAYHLQHGGPKLFLAAYRGFGKSFIAVAYAVWCLYWDPNEKILLVSASQGFAKDLSTFAFQIIRNVPGLAFLDCEGRERHSKISFDVGPARPDKQPSVVALGIGGQLTGNRANRIIADDVEVPNNSDTQNAREKLSIAIQEFAAIIKPGGQIVYLGTPQNESSIYTLLSGPDGRGYTQVLWPIIYPDPALAEVQRGSLSPLILKALADGAVPGEPTDPTRFDAMAIAGARGEYGRSGFALQFQLNTALTNIDRYPLKLRDLVMVACDGPLGPEELMWTGAPQHELRYPEAKGLAGDRFFGPQLNEKVRYAPWQGSFMWIDPSGTGKDETSFAVVKHLNGRLFCPECTGLPGGYADAVMVSIANAAKLHGVNRIVVEKNFGDGMFSKLLLPHLNRIHPCAVEDIHVSQQKELRILDTLEPAIQQHRLCMDPKVFERDEWRSGSLPEKTARFYTLAHQMTRLTREKGCLAQDDRVDALAGAVGLWLDALAQDTSVQAQRSKNRLEANELRAWCDDVFDRKHDPRGGRNGLRTNRAIGLRRTP